MMFLFTILIMIWLNYAELICCSCLNLKFLLHDKEQLDWRFSPHDQLAVLMSPALFSQPDPV